MPITCVTDFYLANAPLAVSHPEVILFGPVLRKDAARQRICSELHIEMDKI